MFIIDHSESPQKRKKKKRSTIHSKIEKIHHDEPWIPLLKSLAPLTLTALQFDSLNLDGLKRIFNGRFQPARSTSKFDGWSIFFTGHHPTSSVAVEDDARSTSGPLYLNIVEDRRREDGRAASLMCEPLIAARSSRWSSSSSSRGGRVTSKVIERWARAERRGVVSIPEWAVNRPVSFQVYNPGKNLQPKGAVRRPVAATGFLSAPFANCPRDMTSACFSPPPIRPPIDLNDQCDTVKVECLLGTLFHLYSYHLPSLEKKKNNNGSIFKRL